MKPRPSSQDISTFFETICLIIQLDTFNKKTFLGVECKRFLQFSNPFRNFLFKYNN